MIQSLLTSGWGLTYPILNAPMAGVARGRLARAVSDAGGLGMLGIGVTNSASFLEEQAAVAREGNPSRRFGIGLTAWALPEHPEIVDAAIAARPFLIAISFGSAGAYSGRIRAAGIHLAAQVNDGASAKAAVEAGAELVIAQGTDSGGHSGSVGTLPLLQIVLDAVSVPVLAAGGIASPRGIAAALAAGAQGVWLGTAFLACAESDMAPGAKERIVAASETDTTFSSLIDRAQGLAWPSRHPGRTLQNQFTREWLGRDEELLRHSDVLENYRRAVAERNFEIAHIYAGQAVGMVKAQRSASEIVHELGEGTEQLLWLRMAELLG